MKMLNTLFWIVGVLAVGYLVLLLFMYAAQSSMIYYPVKELVYSPGDIGLEYENVTFTTEDSVEIHGWFIPRKNARGTLLFHHGNAGNISGRLETIRLVHNLGLNILMYDYRGYGRSEGRPSEKGTYRDAMAAWNYLVEQRMTTPDQIFSMGRSLGGAVAVWLATQTEPAGLILESTFTSAADLGSELYPFLPVRRLIRYEYSNLTRIKDIEVPLLVAHSTQDNLIPFSHGRRLYDAASEPKMFLEMRGRHGGGFIETGQQYRETLDEFISTVLDRNSRRKH